ncbi:diaminopimelate epimerase [Geomicrobium halophilum]|uniref:Diaminopimelate epimerase n=1 Tax=Geomicrobium halophilum TaxID=549000 RepID=A0A841PQV4_9BACL|nr:diaminopimelate epimerase [Geomicrobium halophilum]MBB6450194.1 diaminopimelate epimerase [Geomicrobium halophilum]
MNFTKMHGLGNSYIYIDGCNEPIPDESELPTLAIRVSNPYTGIGSDGLILILPSEVADVRMRVFNNDGSEAKNCGNGLRCVSKYVYEHQYVKKEKFSIETLGGVVEAEVHLADDLESVSEVTVDMGAPQFERQYIPMLGRPDAKVIDSNENIEGVDYTLTAVSMGNPHAVLFVEDVVQAPVHSLGPVIEKAGLFPEGTNVEFIAPLSTNEIDFAVWERGSGVTQACGTGACAAVVAAILNGKSSKDESVVVHLPGGDLTIKWSSKDSHVWMRGPAVTICEGVLY